ncbi:hypothetical protein BDY19DRAFT_898004, partial [Irpex rosettiformis]
MTAFIQSLLGYDIKGGKSTPEGGVLGHVKAYFGCVEAQGRGSLHCHMVIWLQGGISPDDIRHRIVSGDTQFGSRLLAFLDDTISTDIPSAPPTPAPTSIVTSSNPCRHRGPDMDALPADVLSVARAWDLHRLATSCQLHQHRKTCFKYCKPGEPKVCRFDLDPENVQLCSTFDEATGEICLQCLDGMVNNFNRTILEAMRCNMDIQFIGSGEGAKAITYYITNYITKTQLKTHVAYAALELAVRRLGEYNDDHVSEQLGSRPDEDSYTTYAKSMLRRCAYAILTHQELSAQQVASYLMGYTDCYTNATFANLYWPSMERYVEQLHPSPDFLNSDSDLINPCDADDDDDDDDDDAYPEPEAEDITVTVDEQGKLVPSSSQVCDYIYRGRKYDNICIWDFVSQLQK